MGGDMTKAYDAETVDEVTRYMFSVATGNPEHPLALVTFDRITSKEASYRKSALIHTQQEPEITSDGFAIVTNTKKDYSGKMIVQRVGFDTTYTLVGGEGKEFWLSDVRASIPVEAVSPFGIEAIISGSTTATSGISLWSTHTNLRLFSTSVIT